MSLTTDLQVKEKTWRWNINCSYYHYSVDTLASTIGLVVLLNTTVPPNVLPHLLLILIGGLSLSLRPQLFTTRIRIHDFLAHPF
jgi:hypothetical protein